MKPDRTRGPTGKQTIHRMVINVLQRDIFPFLRWLNMENISKEKMDKAYIFNMMINL
jgi:hypothetical protein